MGIRKWDEVLRPQGFPNGQGYILREGLDSVVVDKIRSFNESYKDKIKVIISEPTIGTINWQVHDSCWDMAFYLARYEARSNYKFFKTTIGRMLVAYSRERFAELAVATGFDYIFYIDDDHVWPSDMFERLQAHIKEYDIVAPLCLQRKTPYNPVMYKIVKRKGEDGREFDENVFFDDFEKGHLVTNIDAIGFGSAIVKVDLLRRMPRPWFYMSGPVGEDIGFCYKAKQMGAKLLVDTSVEAPHLKEPEVVTWSDHEREKRKS